MAHRSRWCFLALSIIAWWPSEAAIPAHERNALEKFYESTGGSGWMNSTNWLGAPGSECAPGWFGVRCNADGSNVIGLELNSNKLTGTLPAEIGLLTQLATLNLGSNQLSGSIPSQIGNTNLETLLIENNHLTGTLPDTIHDLEGLTKVDLRFNQLSGSIPIAISLLSKLEELLLEGNQLSGSIPSTIGNLTTLRRLNLTRNQLEGDIPTSLGKLVSLTELLLDQNRLSGVVPPELGSLSNLERLVLGANSLRGSIPSELGNLRQLKLLSIGQCQLTGPIPETLGQLVELEELSLGTNRLTGQIPPTLGNLKKLKNIYLDTNELVGSVPEEIVALPLVQRLHLYRNHLSGGLSEGFASLQLESLNLAGNRFTGVVPKSLGQLISLVELDLASNSLSGPLPADLMDLSQLSSLGLRWNAVFSPSQALSAFINRHSTAGPFETTQTLAPEEVTATPAGKTAILVEWKPIDYTDNEGGYRVRMAEDPKGPFIVVGETANKTISSLLVTALDAGKVYYFQVETFTSPHAANQNSVVSQPSGVRSAATVLTGDPGEFRFSASNYEAAEGEKKLITVERLEGSTGSVTILFSTERGSARLSDFINTSVSLKWKAGDVTPKTAVVQTLSDSIFEGDEVLQIRLSNPSGGSTLGFPSVATLKIVDDDVSSSGFEPAVATDPLGNQLMVWIGPGEGASLDVFGRFVDKNGTPEGDSFRVNDSTPTIDEMNPSVAAVDIDEFVVAWERNGAVVLRCVSRKRGRLVLGAQQIIYVSPTSGASDSTLTINPLTGRVTVVWRVGRQLQGRLFNPTNGTAGSIFRVDGEEFRLVEAPTLANSVDGNTLLAVWQQTRAGGDTDIFARLFDRDGSPIGNEFKVNSNKDGKQTAPAVVGLDNRRYLVAWQSEVQTRDVEEQLGTDILARHIGDDASPLGTEFRVNTSSAGSQEEPKISRSHEGICAVTWITEGASADGIFARILDDCQRLASPESKIEVGQGISVRGPQPTQVTSQRLLVVLEHDDVMEGNGGILIRAQPVFVHESEHK